MKTDRFLSNAALLNTQFGIIPLLYGSLGLEVLTGVSLDADDIDILIPQAYVTGDKWPEFRACLEACGYVLVDEHEHTFHKDDIDYAYASIEGLKDFADIDIHEIEIHKTPQAAYRLLSLAQYLRVYQRSAQDGYRMNVKEKKDQQKIKFIQSKLASEEAASGKS